MRSISAHYGALRVTNSRFERGTGGHYLKSRAPRIEVLDNSFDDSQGRDTNYMIDLPEGAVGRIAGNTFVQGIGKENYGTLIAVHAEEGDNPSAGLVIEDNDASARARLSLDDRVRRRLERRGAGDPQQPPRRADPPFERH